MTGGAGAFALLITRSIRNRVIRQVTRVRNPRYALALVFGLAYLWFAFLRQPAPHGGGSNAAHTVGTVLSAVFGIVLAVTISCYWFGIGVNGALAFQPAEVGLLFPAPVSRHQLIGYKVIRSQVVLALSCLIWAVLIRRWGVTLSFPLRYLTAWGVLSILSLHRLGAALLQVPERRGLRLTVWIPRLLAVTAIGAIALGIGRTLTQSTHVAFDDILQALQTAIHSPPASWGLAPFQLVLTPVFAPSAAIWARGFAVVAALVLAHVVWVVGMNVEFEDTAATATAALARRRAAFRERRAGGSAVVTRGKIKRGWLPLAPLGNPAVAIAWKNTIALSRTGSFRQLILIVVTLIIMVRFMAGLGHGAGANAAAIAPMAIFAVMLFTFGPRMLRNDLRQDLVKLALLKTYPLTGVSLVAAEIASPTLVLGIFQTVLIVVAFLMVPAGTVTTHGAMVTAALLLSPLVLLALNALNVTVQNGLALLFPAWVRLGTDSGGVEVIGQNLLVAFGSMLALLLGLVPPVAAGAVMSFGLGLALGPIGPPLLMATAVVTGMIVLAVEIALLIRALGGTFDRMDLSALG